MKLNPILRRFLEEETGQTTVEYVLMLAVVLTIVMQMRKKLFGTMKKIFDVLDTNVDEAISSDIP
ncbi:MAG: Flp family type IVb pilin [Bdellovibrionota bacterium]